MTHLHLRRASSLQTASCTLRASVDDPNFERGSSSDASQIGTSVANPLASPQPVVGIHFEVRTVEGLIINPPPVISQIPPVNRISIRNALSHADGLQCQPDLAKFTQLRIQELMIEQRSRGRKRRKSAAVWVITGGKCQI